MALLDWAAAARTHMRRGRLAMVTVLATEGSAPRGPGTRMLVTDAALVGTIGGGRLEQIAIEQARAILGYAPGGWRVQDYPLGPLLGQCCGGKVRLLVEHLDPAVGEWLDLAEPGARLQHRFEPDRIVRAPGEAPSAAIRDPRPDIGAIVGERLDPPGRPVLLFGAGHVGRAILDRAAGLPLAIGCFDSRPELANQAGVMEMAPHALEACAAGASPDHAVLIMTHDHGLDYRLVDAALHSEAGFVGLIGSATKRARFLSRLEKDGHGPAARARLTCPIGLPGVDGKAPEAIAIAVLAQLLSLARS